MRRGAETCSRAPVGRGDQSDDGSRLQSRLRIGDVQYDMGSTRKHRGNVRLDPALASFDGGIQPPSSQRTRRGAKTSI